MNIIGFLFLMLQPTNILSALKLHCYEDGNRSVQLNENCRACVLFIDSINISSISKVHLAKKLPHMHQVLTIEELISSSDLTKHRHRRQFTSILHQTCARQSHGPLYGYNQTHCFCDSDQCNYNIQRCIYEVISKSSFSCYHGSNTSEHSALEIRSKCRSCLLHRKADSIYDYECLTFAEDQQNNQTHCTCQQPLCNRNLLTCQRMQPETSPSSQISTFLSHTVDSISSNITVQTISMITIESKQEIFNETWSNSDSVVINVTSSFSNRTLSDHSETEQSTDSASNLRFTLVWIFLCFQNFLI